MIGKREDAKDASPLPFAHGPPIRACPPRKGTLSEPRDSVVGMAGKKDDPAPPRVSAPDLPPRLEPHERLAAREEHFRLEITGLEEKTDAAHSEISECRVAAASVVDLILTGATLVDVVIDDLRATTVTARDARLKRVRITGGRIGTLDLADAELDEVELRGVRIDYLTLAGAQVDDVLIADSTITTLDLPQARCDRVAFENTRSDEVDSVGLRAQDVDLRGLEALSYTDAASLRGVTLSPRQIELLAPAFAATLGIKVKS
ncbi:pentapeptide repeat-containing protein [Microbacterium aoyamense]|uniref:Pentapeptide repeat-containing protein n=2 Tax=Microbacterium aoyamense TaxID=344166 RepID=A0ABN2P8P7_9MICO